MTRWKETKRKSQQLDQQIQVMTGRGKGRLHSQTLVWTKDMSPNHHLHNEQIRDTFPNYKFMGAGKTSEGNVKTCDD